MATASPKPAPSYRHEEEEEFVTVRPKNTDPSPQLPKAQGPPPVPQRTETDESKPLMQSGREDYLEEGYQSIDSRGERRVREREREKERHEALDPPTQFELAIVIFARLGAWIGAFLLIAVGIGEWFEYSTIDNFHISADIVASYLIFFGLVFIFTELSYFFLFKYFGFLFNYLGRGLAYLFTGSLCFGLADNRYWPLGLVGGCTVCGLGALFVFIFLCFPRTPNPKPLCAWERRN
jgi:hypothetical protein